MANFELDDKHRLASDSRQWCLQVRGKDDKDGNEVWTSKRYYSTLSGAVRKEYEHFQRKLDADNVLDFMEQSKRLLDKFVEIFSPKLHIEEK